MSLNEVEEIEKINKTLPKSKVRRRLIKLFLYLFVFFLFSYLVSLIILNTSSVTSKVTKKLDEATGETWEIGSVFWIPFGSVYCNQLKTTEKAKGAGGVLIDSISVKIDWSEIFGGKVSWNEIQIKGGEVNIDRSWLEERLNQSQQNANIEVPKEVKSSPHIQSSKIDTPKANDSLTKRERVDKQSSSKVSGSQAKIETIEAIVDPVKIVFPDKELKVSGVNINIRDQSKIWLAYKDLTMNIPLSGKQRNGSISVYGEENEFYEVPVIFKENDILIEKNTIECLGMNVSLELALNTLSSSKPFLAELVIEEKDYTYEIDQPNLKVRIFAGSVKSEIVIRGNAFNPKSWSGLGNVELELVSVKEIQKTQSELEFDKVVARGTMTNGNILLNYAQAEGDELSFTSNGVITNNGYSYGIFRCIADDEMSKKFEGIIRGSGLAKLDKGFNRLFANLETPDRKYFDVYLDGKLNSMEYKLASSDEWQSLRSFIECLTNFKDNELAEDNLFEIDKK